jgi:hypothetical protein
MPDLSDFHTEFRPRSYFVTKPEIAVLSRIKGAERRKLVRLLGTERTPSSSVIPTNQLFLPRPNQHLASRAARNDVWM